MTRLGFDPRTLSVLRIRDNQLHHPAASGKCAFIVIRNKICGGENRGKKRGFWRVSTESSVKSSEI